MRTGHTHVVNHVTATPIHSSVSRASSATGRSLVPAVTTHDAADRGALGGRAAEPKRLADGVVTARRELRQQPLGLLRIDPRHQDRHAILQQLVHDLDQRFGRLARPIHHFRETHTAAGGPGPT